MISPVVTYREKRILIDGRSQLPHAYTNIYDVDVSNLNEVELLVYSSQARSVIWVKREYGVVNSATEGAPVSL
jgi:hypothetical protein